MRPVVGLVAALALLGAACEGSDPTATGPSSSTAAPTTGSSTPSPTAPSPTGPSPTTSGPAGTPSDLSRAQIQLTEVAIRSDPLAMAIRSGDDALYVGEQVGRIVTLREGAEPEVVLDIRDEVQAGGEQGLLGIAFSPDGAFLYVNYTGQDGNTNVVEYAVDGSGIQSGSVRQVLFVEDPYSNHNGGNLVFGPDGYLYIGLGDGGGGGDPLGSGQALDTLLGKMLRIDPRPSGDQPYGIPPDNPFVDRAGARPEIWAFGLRNPWRYSFDRDTGDLWIGDVGQGAIEEVDFQSAGSPGGENYGWNRLEGTQPFEGDPPPDAVPPIFEYAHEGSECAVTGGYVYRGTAIPDLWGAYLVADFCVGQIIALRVEGGEVVEQRELGPPVSSLASFGEDANGELYVMSLAGPVYRIGPA